MNWIAENAEFFGPLAVLMLVGVMLLKEFVRTMDRPWTRTGMIVLNVIILPLIVFAGLAMVLRLASLLNPA